MSQSTLRLATDAELKQHKVEMETQIRGIDEKVFALEVEKKLCENTIAAIDEQMHERIMQDVQTRA